MQATATELRYLSYAQAEIYTGPHRVTLWRATKRRELRISGPEAAPRFCRHDLDRWMRRRNR